MRISAENHKFYGKTIAKLAKAGHFTWTDVLKEIKGTVYEPKNWMAVRGSLQEAINAGKIQRVIDIRAEMYIAL